MPITRSQAFERKLSDYFRSRLLEFAENLSPKPHEDTLWYLGSLLARLGQSRNLFSRSDGALTIRPLALLYKDAHEAGDGQVRCLLLRQLGDQALFLGALFAERYARRGLKRDYFVGMGGGAYDYLSDHAETQRHVYAELADNFAKFIEVAANACNREGGLSTDEVMRLYVQWKQTGSERLAKQLRSLGIPLEDSVASH